MIGQLISAFLTSFGYAFFFQIHRRNLLAAGLIGSLGWAVYLAAGPEGRTLFATFIASFSVGLCSELLARQKREPAVMYAVPGIFPLVPGVLAYRAMLALARGDSDVGLVMTVNTLFYGGAIAGGLALATTLFRLRQLRRQG